ncbi:MAG: AraC family transcriptional regulator, transcriptional activator of pobA [Solirubrobacteraceae bacterium]|nr:AraC family transcriptional regulator, transcriptional activator of pobA [Solirubrobacteraceae bacterium]
MSIPRHDPAPSPPPPASGDGGLPVDRLARAADPVQVVVFDGFDVGLGADPVREPHRHDYHELIWIEAGSGHHLLDGQLVPILPGTLTMIGRGQVHVFERARAVKGAAVRFGEEILSTGPLARSDPSWLLAGCGRWTVTVPADHREALQSTIRMLAAEAAGPADPHSADLQLHLLSLLLVWIERWYDAERTERRDVDDSGVQLFRRFVGVLEHDFAAHHDAVHYADALAVPPAALSQTLNRVTGRSTKELVTDRVMLEAARLLRFTDKTMGEIAYETGFSDPLYFSRAFKRHHGQAPSTYRELTRGVQRVA